ncbi:hypothetical protein GWI33_000474 [Rhynchophorus ferrugineus]|uniref:Uncharacterized protein n=1 Tax=Rhynchophorus ferrugineus TaxID=354439 RepID=A0A834HMG3_RHYFE|nr:hypothetical protein GWI33_000474 [Rhynchophorus ferrugineus]
MMSRVQCTKDCVCLGHNMSHADGNSTEGESTTGGGGSKNPSHTGTGCYRNFDHFPNRHRRSNSSTTPCLPINEGPPPCSPSSQRRQLLDLGVSNPSVEDSYQQSASMAPLAQDETQLLPGTPKGYISPSADSKKSDTLRKADRLDEIPSEFECCFCTTKEYDGQSQHCAGECIPLRATKSA